VNEFGTPYIVLNELDGIISAAVNVRRGQGRQARRHLWRWLYVRGPLTPETLPNVLRLVADELEASPSARYRPPAAGLGSPSGAVGGETPS